MAGKEITEVRVGEVRFLREQDGRPERLLKQELIALFRGTQKVDEAYLARCAFGPDVPEGVVLAIHSPSGPNMTLVEEVRRVFASVFVKREHLDILFVDDNQQRQVASVCLPFYQSPATHLGRKEPSP
jgi:hypothetical protein